MNSSRSYVLLDVISCISLGVTISNWINETFVNESLTFLTSRDFLIFMSYFKTFQGSILLQSCQSTASGWYLRFYSLQSALDFTEYLSRMQIYLTRMCIKMMATWIIHSFFWLICSAHERVQIVSLVSFKLIFLPRNRNSRKPQTPARRTKYAMLQCSHVARGPHNQSVIICITHLASQFASCPPVFLSVCLSVGLLFPICFHALLLCNYCCCVWMWMWVCVWVCRHVPGRSPDL